MKYKRLRFALLSMFVMLGAVSSTFAQNWVKTDAADLQTGDVVVIVDQTSSTAMSNDKGTSAAPVATAVTLNDAKSEITGDVADNLKWVVTVDNGSYKFQVADTDNYLYCTNTNNGVRVGDNANNAFTITTGGDNSCDFLVNTATTRYIGVYNSQDWRCYTSINNNIKATITAFYKQQTVADNRIASVTQIGAHATTLAVGETDRPEATVTVANENGGGNLSVTWSSSDETVATISDGVVTAVAPGTTTIKATFAGDETYKGSSASYTLTVTKAPYTSIAAMLNDISATKTTVTYKFQNIVVAYVNGKYTYISDKGDYMLLYGENLGLEADKQYSGSLTGQLYTYNGLPEIALSANDINAEAGVGMVMLDYQMITVDQLPSNINKPCAIANAVFVSANGKNLTFTVGETELTVYNQFNINTESLEEGMTYTILGFGGIFNTTYQLYPYAFYKTTPAGPTYRDFAVNLTDANIFDTSVNSFGVKIAEDGTYSATAADDATANFTVSANRFNDAQHGWVNCTFTIPVKGAVKIELGDCQYGGQNGTITDAAGNQTEIKANATKGCWNPNAPHDKVVVAYYAGTEPTTLTVVYNGYCPFIAVTAIDPADIPHEATLTFDAANIGAEGIAPAQKKVEIGSKVVIPANTTLFIEGSTLTAWTDGTANYAAGEEVTVTADMTLTPVFTANTVAFADRTAETTITWQFGEGNGAGTLNAQGGKTILVAQATIGDQTIDVKMDIDATNGKMNNVGRGDKWAQCNDGTILTIPAYKGAKVTLDTYGDAAGTTVAGVEVVEKAATYEGSNETLDIVAKGMSYIASVTAVYPVPAAEEEKFVDVIADFTNGAFFTAEETNVTTAGLKMNEDGTFSRVAADDATANAVITGKFHSNEHGLGNFSAVVPVKGCVKVSMGTCAWGGDVEVKNAEGAVIATFNTNTGACYHNDKTANIVSAYYKTNEATTLTIAGGSYTPYFAVEAVSPEDIPSDITITYALNDETAQGTVPAEEIVGMNKDYTIAKNFTIYKEGYTLAWTDGTNTYKPGDTFTTGEENITLTATFIENTVSLADRTEAVTLKWNFRRDQGAPAVGWEGKDNCIWVTQATIGEETIDVALPFSTNPGKFNNTNNTDWVQINNGTTFTVPSCKGAVVSMEAYNDITTTTIDGQSDYGHAKTISYTIANTAENIDVVIGDGAYYRYIQVVLPFIADEGPKSFDNVAGTISWPVGNEAVATLSEGIEGSMSLAAVSVGGDLKVESAKYFEVNMVKYTPANSNAGNVEGVLVEYRVKPAHGVTFQPTNVTYAAVKVGTDGATYSWSYVVNGEETEITTVDAKKDLLRNNGANEATAKLKHSHDITAEACGEFAFRIYISNCANNKNICIGDMVISGIVNGEVAPVNKYTFAANAAPAEAGSVNIYPKGDEFEEGTEITLTATENFGYDFVNWTDADGVEVSTEAKFKYTITNNAVLTANFKQVNTYELALTVDGTNDYMVSISPAPTMVDNKMMYEEGTAVELTANQYEGLVTFNNWSDGETNSQKIVLIDDNVAITAVYAQADIIAGWDFFKAGGDGRIADFYAPDNDATSFLLVNEDDGSTSGWLDKSTVAAGGYESFKGAAVNWRQGDENGDVGHYYWMTKINAEAFTNITVQNQMLYNYNSYKDYNVEYSLDGDTWVKFGTIHMEGAKNAASFSKTLPEAANNQKELSIRWIADKESSIDGTASKNDGNAIAMVFITGTPKLIDDGKAPVLVSTVPANGAENASATGKIVLTFDEKIVVADGAMASLDDMIDEHTAMTLQPKVSGKTISFDYKGLEYSTTYTFTLLGQNVSDLTGNALAEDIVLSFTTMTRPSVEKGAYDAVVGNVDELVAAIKAANSRADKTTRYRIFMKKGTYQLPADENTKVEGLDGNSYANPITFITASNISFIGEDRDATIITQTMPEAEGNNGYNTAGVLEGIGKSDVLQIASSVSGLYFQDVTVKSGIPDARGRNIAIQDKGMKNIYKNVCLWGYQDTWTSNNDYGLYYFEGGVLRGRTDFLCGKGDIFYNGVELRMCEKGGYLAVPSKSVKYGYVFKDCVINGEKDDIDGNYTLGRPWGSGTPKAYYIDTRMNVKPSAIGWNEMSGGWPAQFAEYNSTTSTGSVIDLSGRKKEFGNDGDKHANVPVLTPAEALEIGNLHNMFGDWDPTLQTEQAPVPADVVLSGTNLTWTNSNYALLWAVVKNGDIVAFTTEPIYAIDDADATWAVRAANEMGGLSEAIAATAAGTDGISEVSKKTTTDTIYNMQGIRVNNALKRGLYIIDGKKVIK